MKTLSWRLSRAPYLALSTVLLLGISAGVGFAGSKAEREAAEQRQRQELEWTRERARANTLAELLIREEEARLRRQEEQAKMRSAATARAAVSGGRPVAVASAAVEEPYAGADARLDQVFGEASTWSPPSRGPADYPSAIVVSGAEPAVAAAGRAPSQELPVAPAAQAAPGPGEPANWQASTPDDGLELFHSGYSHFSQGDYEGARQAFARFLGNYAGHELADSAQYWIGECAYAQGDYETAYVEYRKVVESFPFGDKVADAMLKSGYSLMELGREAEARRVLGLLVSEYPDSGAARRARERLNGSGTPPATQ
jgi:tol-pal system protein YbgF